MIKVAQLVKDLSKNIYDEEVRAEFESEVSYHLNFIANVNPGNYGILEHSD